MKVSQKCRARTCPCKGCPQVEVCYKGCAYCNAAGKTYKMDYCFIMRRDGKRLYEERKAEKREKEGAEKV